jgi:hypothetical protein
VPGAIDVSFFTVAAARHALQTFHALKASDMADAFNEAMRRMVIAPGEFVPELTAPTGPSTAGGVQAMQHLRLVPRLPGFPTIIAGQANHAQGTAELRSYEHVAAIHRQRYRRPIGLDKTGYEQFLAVAKSFLEALRLETSIAGPPADSPIEEGTAPDETGALEVSRKSGVFVAICIAVVAVVLVAAWWMLLGRR